MKKYRFSKILSALLGVAVIFGSFNACNKDVVQKSTTPATAEAQEQFLWITKPCIEAEKISILVNTVFNENTNHYDFKFNSLFEIRKDGKCGLINTDFEMVLKPEYDDIFAIRDSDDFIGIKNSEQTYIHSDTLYTESAHKTYNSSKYEYYFNKSENKLYFADNTDGDFENYDAEPVMPEAVAGVKNSYYEKDGTYGLYVNGKEITGMIYQSIGYYNDGIVAVKKGEKWGYIDSAGNTVIPFEMDAVSGYNAFSGDDIPYESSEGYVAVCKGGKFAYYTNSGEQLCDFIYDEATPCVDGRAYVKQNGKWGIISLTQTNEETTTAVTKSVKTTSKHTEATTEHEETTTKITENTDGQKYIVDTDTLYLRREIGSDSIIMILDMDDVVICDEVSDGWAHLVFDDCDGWVKLEYLREATQN